MQFILNEYSLLLYQPLCLCFGHYEHPTPFEDANNTRESFAHLFVFLRESKQRHRLDIIRTVPTSHFFINPLDSIHLSSCDVSMLLIDQIGGSRSQLVCSLRTGAGLRRICVFANDARRPAKVTKRTRSSSKAGTIGTSPPRARALHRPFVRTTAEHHELLCFVSSSNGHADHSEDCCITHLLDAVRLDRSERELEAALQRLSEEYTRILGRVANEHSYITILRGRSIAILNHEIDRSESLLLEHKAVLKRAQELKIDLESRIHVAKRALSKAMKGLYETTDRLCESARKGRRPDGIVIKKNLVYNLQLTRHRAGLLADEETALRNLAGQLLESTRTVQRINQSAIASGSDRVDSEHAETAHTLAEARANRKRLLDDYEDGKRLLKAGQAAQRYQESEFLQDYGVAALGDMVHVVQDVRAESMALLESQYTRPTVSDATLPMQPNRDTKGRPLANKGREFPTLDVFKELREAEANLRRRESEFGKIRQKYLSLLSQFVIAYPQGDRAHFDAAYEDSGLQSFDRTQEQAEKDIEEARRECEDARCQVRAAIDAESEQADPSLADRTSDHNTGSEDFNIRPMRIAAIDTAEIRNWHAGVARAASPTTANVQALRSPCSSSANIDAIFEVQSSHDFRSSHKERRDRLIRENQRQAFSRRGQFVKWDDCKFVTEL